MTSGEARIRREIAKCNDVFERNSDYYRQTGKRKYYRAAQKAYVCAQEMDAILRLAQTPAPPQRQATRYVKPGERP